MDVSGPPSRIGLARSRDLTSQVRFIAPDDGNGDDRTVMAVAAAVCSVAAERDDPDRASSGTARFRARSRAPATSTTSTSSRSGFRSSACSKTAGWNTHQFHAPTEFYADFGVYDVRLTVPSRLHRRRDRPRDGAHGQRATARPRIAIAARTSTTSRGRRAPITWRSRGRFDASVAAAGRHAAAAAARARGPGRALLRMRPRRR